MPAIEVRRAEPRDRTPIRNMFELYSYDLSDYWSLDLDAHGQFGFPTLDYYWTAPKHAAFVFLVDGKYAGFALVDDKVRLPENQIWMAQFFVMRRHRRQGVGCAAAAAVFDAMPGKWEMGQFPFNLPSQAFWQKAVGAYTNGKFSNAVLDSQAWRGPLQWFDNTPPAQGTPA